MDWCHKQKCIDAVEEIKIIRKGTVYSKGTFYSKVSAKDQIIDDFSSDAGLTQFIKSDSITSTDSAAFAIPEEKTSA